MQVPHVPLPHQVLSAKIHHPQAVFRRTFCSAEGGELSTEGLSGSLIQISKGILSPYF